MRALPATLLFFIATPALAASTVPVEKLSPAEQTYYQKTFDYTMDNITAGNHYDWASYGGKGSIGVNQPFISKSGYTCRNYSESYAIGSQTGSMKGIACRRIGKEGWCKLKENAEALTCAMEGPYYNIATPHIGAMPDMPNVNFDSPNVSGIGGVNMPSYNGPSPSSSNNKPSASNAADSITSGAGAAAGYVAKNAGSWFSSLFR